MVSPLKREEKEEETLEHSSYIIIYILVLVLSLQLHYYQKLLTFKSLYNFSYHLFFLELPLSYIRFVVNIYAYPLRDVHSGLCQFITVSLFRSPGLGSLGLENFFNLVINPIG